MSEKKKRRARAALAGLCVLFILASAFVSAVTVLEEPPAREEAEAPGKSAAEETEAPAGALPEAAVPAGRMGGVYTLLLAGLDSASGSTDAILVGRLDTGRHRLDLVSLPRDTLVNLAWEVRKLNAVYPAAVNRGESGLEALRQQIRCLTGFLPDCSAVIDMDVFEQAVDLIGGVDFDVPIPMSYDDPEQGLSIRLEAGPQRLSGAQAMGLVRYRSGYLNGDLDRVAVQQDFLRAALGQMIARGGLPALKELAQLVAEHTDTDLSAANVVWLLRQLLLCGKDGVQLTVMPNTPADVHGLSYVTVELEPWLTLLNERLNPYDLPVTPSALDVVYRVGGAWQASSGRLRGPEYYW